MFGRDGAWGTWVHRWTAEEGRHGVAIRDYLLTTRAVDPIALERARMMHMGGGLHQPTTPAACSTPSRTSRSRSWRPACRTATPAASAATRSATSCWPRSRPTRTCTCSSTATCSAPRSTWRPNAAMRAVREVVKTFQMPGHTIENFGRKSVQIAMAGIYDLRIHHDEVVMPILRQLNVMTRTGLVPEGEADREKLAAFMSDLDKNATRFEERREASRAGQQPAVTKRRAQALCSRA